MMGVAAVKGKNDNSQQAGRNALDQEHVDCKLIFKKQEEMRWFMRIIRPSVYHDAINPQATAAVTRAGDR